MKLRIESDGTRQGTTVTDETGAERTFLQGMSLEMLELGEIGVFLDASSRHSELAEDIDEIELHFKGPIFVRRSQRNAAKWPRIELDPTLMKRNQVA